MKIFFGVVIANITTILLFCYIFFFPYNSWALTGLFVISFSGYLLSYYIIDDAIKNKEL
jgi:hypothetical protein